MTWKIVSYVYILIVVTGIFGAYKYYEHKESLDKELMDCQNLYGNDRNKCVEDNVDKREAMIGQN